MLSVFDAILLLGGAAAIFAVARALLRRHLVVAAQRRREERGLDETLRDRAAERTDADRPVSREPNT